MSILSILFTIFVLLVLWGFISEKNDWDIGSSMSVVFSMVMIPIIIGVSLEEDSDRKWVETKVEIVKTKNIVFVVDDQNDYHIYDKAIDYNSINDSTTVFYREHTTNVWGYEDIEDIKYENYYKMK